MHLATAGTRVRTESSFCVVDDPATVAGDTGPRTDLPEDPPAQPAASRVVPNSIAIAVRIIPTEAA
jgi:hypothetical protein